MLSINICRGIPPQRGALHVRRGAMRRDVVGERVHWRAALVEALK
jgi:hypothetical protein